MSPVMTDTWRMQVREELQRFLEDDDDMAKMCLTRKKELERVVSTGAPSAAGLNMRACTPQSTHVTAAWLCKCS